MPTVLLCGSTIPATTLVTKTIKVPVFLATNPMALPRKLKMAPITLPSNAGNASTVFPASFLTTSGSLFSHFFKVPSNFGGEDPEAAGLLPKTPVITSAIVVIVVEMAEGTGIILATFLQNRVQILSAKNAS